MLNLIKMYENNNDVYINPNKVSMVVRESYEKDTRIYIQDEYPISIEGSLDTVVEALKNACLGLWDLGSLEAEVRRLEGEVRQNEA